MTVALLSCGPSLARYPGPERFGLVVAVNRVATAFGCDYWSVGDAETYLRHARDLVSLPALWTHADALRRIERHRGCAIPARTYARDERSAPWTLFSATAALWLAGVGLGAVRRVECWGADFAGTLNWDATPEPTADRSEDRWRRERAIWDALAGDLNGRGVEVVRHAP